MESRIEKAEALFREGYNCSQAVFLAYADLVGIDFDTAKSFPAALAEEWEGCGRPAEPFPAWYYCLDFSKG